MTNLTPMQLVVIGAAIVFGMPAVAGIIAAHFLGPTSGVAIGILLLAAVLAIGHKQLTKRVREQEKHENTEESPKPKL